MGWKPRVVETRAMPFSCATSAANLNNHWILERVLEAVSPILGQTGRPIHRAGKLHADKTRDRGEARSVC